MDHIHSAISPRRFITPSNSGVVARMSHSPCEWCGDDVKLSSIVNVVEQSGSAARVCRKCAAEDEAARELQAELAWGPPSFEEFALGGRF